MSSIFLKALSFLHFKFNNTPPTLLKTLNNQSSHLFLSKTLKMSSSSWTCTKCTFINSPSQNPTCKICLTNNLSLSLSQSSSPSSPKWPCKACTFLNSYKNTKCEVCDTTKVSTFDDLNDVISNSGDGGADSSSVGSVFMPLKSCSKGVKRKISEYPINDNDDDCVEIETGFRGVKAMAVNNKFGDGSGSSSTGVIKALANVVSVKDDSDSKVGSKPIKILSYNVWFREDLELYMRMKAIGDLIQLHSPDIICFQEVTTEIYHIFCKSSWWKMYKCSISPDKAAAMGYSCMLLSKLPVKSFDSIPFGNSIMARELCIAEVEVRGSKPLVIATSHLESPCPAPPKWDQMFSKERVEQAKEAVSFLKKNPNVIFGGDMNWDDKLDGPFPLEGGWVDSWTELRPGEIGWTYDTKSNQMLSGNRTLQKRLDRFACKLQDFKVTGIEMIGKEAIPALYYTKEKKVRKEIKMLELPVLPSDHFGLLLTIYSQ
ncbi:hypothetical protein ACFE04_003149 [Oxalis oulophora]